MGLWLAMILVVVLYVIPNFLELLGLFMSAGDVLYGSVTFNEDDESCSALYLYTQARTTTPETSSYQFHWTQPARL